MAHFPQACCISLPFRRSYFTRKRTVTAVPVLQTTAAGTHAAVLAALYVVSNFYWLRFYLFVPLLVYLYYKWVRSVFSCIRCVGYKVFTVWAKNLLLVGEFRLVYAALCFYLYVFSLDILFFFLSFRRVVNVIYSFLGNSPASEI